MANNTAIYIMLAAVIVLLVMAVAATVLLVVLLRRKGGVSAKQLADEGERTRQALATQVKVENSMLTGAMNAQSDSIRAVGGRLDAMTASTGDRLARLQDDMNVRLSELKLSQAEGASKTAEQLAAGLAKMLEENARQLEKMRETVDEKLSGTLDKRLTQSFKLVGDRLEELGRTFAELQGLQSGVNDLSRIFSNVKARGTWGEIALDNLLSQLLTPSQYYKQRRIKRGSEDAVDFAIRLPGRGDGEVLLPVDCKFPIEDYVRLQEAADKGDGAGVEAASKALAKRVKQDAMSIRDKYICPPQTTDFAIMYLPTEGLYAEIARNAKLLDELQNGLRVLVCGPTTISALLNSLQLGFRTLAIEKQSTEIAKLLRVFNADFEKFAALLQRSSDKLSEVQKALGDAEDRTQLIRQRLDKLQPDEIE